MDEIQPILTAYGFEDTILEGRSPAEQISLFRDAEAVVGVHGAGLTNILFSPPDCKIVSIESDLNLRLGTSKFYSALADASGLAYEALRVKRAPMPVGAPHNYQTAHNQDVIVPPVALEALLLRFLSPPGGLSLI